MVAQNQGLRPVKKSMCFCGEITVRALTNRNLLWLRKIKVLDNQKNEKKIQEMTNFTLSILGIGLFNYYVGRSHDNTLVGPSWPVFILLTIFADRLFSDLSFMIRGKDRSFRSIVSSLSFDWAFKTLFFSLILFFLSFFALSVATNFPLYRNVITLRISGIKSGIPDPLREKIEFINANTHKDDKVFIFSDFAPVLYLYTRMQRPLPVPGFGEPVLTSDWELINNFLENPPDNAKIFWDPDFATISPTQFGNLIPGLYSPNQSLILYENISK